MRTDRELNIVIRGVDETGTVFEKVAAGLDELSSKAKDFSDQQKAMAVEDSENSQARYDQDLAPTKAFVAGAGDRFSAHGPDSKQP